MVNRKNLLNKKFDKLLVIEELGRTPQGSILWLCQCECGNKKVVPSSRLINKDTKSCGCYRKKLMKDKMSQHNMSNTKIYKAWRSMISRCTNPRIKRYKNYGGRGIKVCNRWLQFKNFYADMNNSYQSHIKKYGEHETTLDRKDVNKDYCKENCR